VCCAHLRENLAPCHRQMIAWALTLTINAPLRVKTLMFELRNTARELRKQHKNTDLAEQEQRACAFEAHLPGYPNVTGHVLGCTTCLKKKVMSLGLSCQ
jgi:hypothetical protein